MRGPLRRRHVNTVRELAVEQFQVLFLLRVVCLFVLELGQDPALEDLSLRDQVQVRLLEPPRVHR